MNHEVYNIFCSRCGRNRWAILDEAKSKEDRLKDESATEYINRVIPCITEDELIIKKLLE